MAKYPIANIGVTSAFTKDINHIAAIRTQLGTALTGIIHSDEEAVIEKVTMKSANAFTVSLSGSVKATAELKDTEYVVEYEGIIDRIVFDANTTLTYFQVGWSQMPKCHIKVEFNTTETITVTGPSGVTLVADEDGKYECISGTGYVVETSTDKYYVVPKEAGSISL